MYKYVYWSERAVKAFMGDNGMREFERELSFKSPTLSGVAPEVGVTQKRVSGSRFHIARSILRKLGRNAVADVRKDVRPYYVRGRGFISFGKFVSGASEPLGALMFSRLTGSDRSRIVVCMFGSLDGFPGYVLQDGPTLLDGWTASEWRAIKKFVDDGCNLNVEIWGQWYTAADLPYFVYQVAAGQGENFQGNEPWNRGYMYGDVNGSAEWLMEVYCDLSEIEDRDDRWNFRRRPYDRILIGRPVWIRTRIESDVRIYSRYTEAERRAWPPPSQQSRSIAKGWFRRRM